MKFNKQSLIVLRAGLTVSLFIFLLWRVDLTSLVTTTLMVGKAELAGAVFIQCFQAFIAGLRWNYVLKALGLRAPQRETLQVFWIGLFFNTCVPGAVVGDAARVVIVKTSGAPLGRAVASILIDRIAGVLGLLSVLAIVTPFASFDDRTLTYGITFGAAAALVAAVCLIASLKLLSRWSISSYLEPLYAFSGNFRMVVSSGYLVAILFCSIAAPLLTATTVFVLMRSLDAQINFVDCLAIMPLVTLAATLPISIGGWGVREGAMVVLFALVGASTTISLTVSVTIGALSLLISLPGGLLCALGRKNGLAREYSLDKSS